MNRSAWLAAMRPWRRSTPRLGGLALDIGLSLAVLGLVGLSYRSIDQWRRGSQQVAEQRANVTLTLLALSLYHDMRGAQLSALLPLEFQDVIQDPPHDLRDRFSRAFAQFPYPESFFVLKQHVDGSTTFDLFNRTDRPPSWAAPAHEGWDYPTILQRDSKAGRPLAHAMREHTDSNAVSGFVVSETIVEGIPYQVVGKVLRPPSPRETAVAVVGFTVNLEWVRAAYFNQLLNEVSRVSDAAAFTSLAVDDADGRAVAVTRTFRTDDLVQQRQFSLMFFDPALLSAAPPRSELQPWTVKVGVTQDRMLIAPQLDAWNAYAMLTVVAIVSVIGIVLTARAVRSRAALAAMQSDFVCTVTHDLKTPLASIRLMAETLSRGAAVSQDTMTDYARLLSQQAWRLTRQVDNILTFARVSNSKRRQLEAIEIAELVEDGLQHFQAQLEHGAFTVTVDVPQELPHVRGDRTLLLQAFENLVDNAIKYSADRREIRIHASVDGRWLRLEVADAGIGIEPASVPYVFEKFYRGQSVPAGGSGLGLAIVKRIVDDHHGDVRVKSVRGAGTTVQLMLPLDETWRAEY